MMRRFRQTPVLPGERLDDLQRSGMFLLQRPDAFCFGTDSVLLAAFAAMAERRGIRLSLCAEDVDVPGVVHAGCLSRELVERVAGCRLDVRPSQQRAGCKCVASVDVGVYGTCGNGCLYCYANQDGVPVGRGSALHDPASPLLVGRLSADDEVTDQRCASLKSRQFSLL